MESDQAPRSDVLENLVFRFETAWDEGDPPAIEDFLPEAGDDRWAVLVELAHVDLEFRLKSGNGVQVEQYFARFPQWHEHEAEAVDLIVAEFDLRARSESPPSLEEYRGRFPHLWDQLFERLTATHRALGETLCGLNSQSSNNAEQTQPYHGGADGTSPSSEHHDAFRYRVISNHASGGLGDVYLAHDGEVSREVALKQLKSQFADDPDSRARFLREAEITGGLEHPGIVPVYGMGAYDDGRPYYAMRFVRGGSFKAAIERYHEIAGVPELEGLRTLKLRKLLARFIEVCHAIDYAHSRGIVHRDIKPANIMLGKYGETLVVDWGLAKPIGRDETAVKHDEVTLRPQSGSGSSATQAGSAVGTPAYMSPEQAAGHVNDLGPATDVFSLGATLYHLLTGQSPQTSSEVPVVLSRVTHGEFPAPREIRGDVPAGLEAICLKAMAFRPADRYRTAGAIAADIENWLADEPVAAHRESWWDRSRRWMRRHRTIVSSSLVAAVLLVGVGIAAFVTWDRARQQSRSRREQAQASAAAADQSALAELRSGRYSSAGAILDTALHQLETQPRLTEARQRILARKNLVQRLADFHRLSAQAEESAILENDTAAVLASQSALDALNVFDEADWWAHLPDDELTPQQADRLRQRVYDQLILLTLFKSKALLADFVSPASAETSRELLEIAEWVQRFRHAESIAAMQDIARLRLGQGLNMPDIFSLKPKTAADNNAAGVMAWSMSQSQVIRNVTLAGRPAGGNLNEVARDFLVRSTALDPDRYMTMITLAFIHAQLGEYSAARQACNQCIVLRPDDCLSYCIRAETNLAQAADTGDKLKKASLLHAALVDAEKARDLSPATYYVHWYRGRALREMGQTSEAVAAFVEAIRLEKQAVQDSTRVLNKHFEAVQETREYARELVRADPDNADFWSLLATAALSLGRYDEAADAASCVLAIRPDDSAALAIRGAAALRGGNVASARDDFQAALDRDGENYAAAAGLAHTLQQLRHFPSALEAYARAASLAKTDWQVAEMDVGRCATLMQIGDFAAAADALRTALARDPSCNVDAVRQMAAKPRAQPVRNIIDGRRDGLKFGNSSSARRARVLPLLNGGFELGLSAYWGQPEIGTPIWYCRSGCRSTAEVSRGEPHSGEMSLHIRHASPAAEGAFAETSQSFPATAGARYHISLWAKANGLAVNGVYLVVGESIQVPHVDLPAGTYDWQQVAGEFTAESNEIRLRILSRDVGEVWLDDIRVELVEQ